MENHGNAMLIHQETIYKSIKDFPYFFGLHQHSKHGVIIGTIYYTIV